MGFAVMALLLRKQKDGSPIESIILGNLLAGAIGLPFMLMSPPPDAAGFGALLVLGVFQLGVPYLLYSYSIKRVTALEAVLIPVIEPVLNPVWVLLFLGERPGSLALLGGAIVLGAVVVRALIALRAGKVRPIAVP
jgi:drug/metabolite transporter (DMT)-like permease